MLNAGVLRFDALGKVRNTVSVPVDFNAGVGSANNLLSVDLNGPVRWVNGMPFVNNGRLSVQTAGTVVEHAQGGLPINEAGAVAIDTVAVVSYWSAGLPFTSTGKLAFAGAE
jgi:hypothetical protein